MIERLVAEERAACQVGLVRGSRRNSANRRHQDLTERRTFSLPG